jgi:hypothetical protein
MSVRKNHAAKSRPFVQGRSRLRALVGGTGVVLICFILASNSAQALTPEEEAKKAKFDQIDEGFRLFTTETWDGNGRTCGTCHIPEVNYNIFPSTIQNMSQEDKDLVFAKSVPGLENENLVRERALFNVMGNATSFGANEPDKFADDDPGHPVFRGSMGIQGLEITSTNESPNFAGTPLMSAVCNDGVAGQLKQIGWSGDGSPGTPTDGCHINHGNPDPIADGSIRAFANGAIAQHSTQDLRRRPGIDFRFATEEEADALAALQEWLGRRPLTDLENKLQGTVGATEFDITRLDFTDKRINLGRDHFAAPAEFTRTPAAGDLTAIDLNPNPGAGCNGCHTNAGANTGIGPPGAGQGGSGGVGGPNNRGQNININTDVELGSDDIGLNVVGVGVALPHDEGGSDSFGRRRLPPPFDEAFNIQSLPEAPRKEAWFHNHRVVGDFEQAIAFYITNDFRQVDSEEDLASAETLFGKYNATTRVAVALTSEEVMRFGNASRSEGTISFPDGDGIEHLGAFLRVLSAYYSLRDCERLVQEAIDRIGVGASPELPVKHCKFNLADVQKVLDGSKLNPKPYGTVLKLVSPVQAALEKALKGKTSALQVAGLRQVIGRLQGLRTSIAHTTP